MIYVPAAQESPRKIRAIFVWWADMLVIAGAAVILARLFAGENLLVGTILAAAVALTLSIHFLSAEPTLEWTENGALLATLLIVELLVTIFSAIVAGMVVLAGAAFAFIFLPQPAPFAWWPVLAFICWAIVNGLLFLLRKAKLSMG